MVRVGGWEKGCRVAGLSVAVLALLALLGLAGGVGITALGPGGILPTIGLFAFSGLPPSTVAGTAIVTHIATGLLGSAAYTRSGQLREPRTRRIAVILCATATVGAPLGVVLNSAVSSRAYGILLGALAAVVGVLVWYRERRSGARADRAQRSYSMLLLASLGLMIATVSGLFGIGGPMLTVPLLVVIGVPVLSALAAAQVQSVVIAIVSTIGYLTQGAVLWPLALLIGVPELCGVLIGWKIAHCVPTRTLRYALVAALFVLAPYLALHG